MSRGGFRHDSGCCHRSDLARPGVDQHACARLERGTRCTHVIHQDDTEAAHVCRPSERERATDIGVPSCGRKVGL
jgi:hypothetical protein